MKALNYVLLLAIVFAFGCKGGGLGKNSPENVLKSMIYEVEKGNYEKAMDFLSNTDGEKYSEEEEQKAIGFLGMLNAAIDNNGGIKDIEIVNVEIDEEGENAAIDYLMIYKNDDTEEGDAKLVLFDGEWKITKF